MKPTLAELRLRADLTRLVQRVLRLLEEVAPPPPDGPTYEFLYGEYLQVIEQAGRLVQGLGMRRAQADRAVQTLLTDAFEATTSEQRRQLMTVEEAVNG